MRTTSSVCPIDRAFTVKGTGTVVTGTVWSGTWSAMAPCACCRSSSEARVRGIETHGRAADRRAVPARAPRSRSRGVEVAEVSRGMTLVAGEGWYAVARAARRGRAARERATRARRAHRRAIPPGHAGGRRARRVSRRQARRPARRAQARIVLDAAGGRARRRPLRAARRLAAHHDRRRRRERSRLRPAAARARGPRARSLPAARLARALETRRRARRAAERSSHCAPASRRPTRPPSPGVSMPRRSRYQARSIPRASWTISTAA